LKIKNKTIQCKQAKDMQASQESEKNLIKKSN
jgi:hypothetical protein